MPTTALTDANNQNRRMFSYDEMVMASDGTRFYIKYLDGPSPQQAPKPATVTQQRAQQATQARQTASRAVVQKTTTLPTANSATLPAAKRQRVAPTQAPQVVVPQHVQCGICLQKFKNMPSLNFHIEKTHKDSEGPVDCPCGKRFANKKYMKRHQKRRFETERIICGREKQAGSNAAQSGFRVNYQNL